ncbi:MAG: MFS transporter [Christensenellaceae bacterium]|jgi:PPP family 3-phenylpropionic acid transporter
MKLMKRVSGAKNMEAIKFSVLIGLFWLAIAIGGYQTTFMIKNGFGPTTVGIVNAMASAVSIASTPIWGMLSDKMRSVKKVTMLLFFIGGVFIYSFFPVSAKITVLGIPLLAIMVPLASFFRSPFFTLLDNWLIQGSHKKGLNYGPIRSVGSFTYAVGGIFASLILIPNVGLQPVFYISAVMFLVVIFISSRVDDVDSIATTHDNEKLSFKELKVGQLFKNYYYVIFLIFTFTFSLVTNCDNNFLSFLLEDVGSDAVNYGLVSGLRALFEIPILLYLATLRKRLSYYQMTVLSAITLILGVLSTGLFSNNLIHVLIFSILPGVATGINIGSAANYVYTLAPDHLKATAHTIFSAVSSVAGILGNLAGGKIIELVGAKTFYVFLGIFLAASLVLYIVLHAFGRRLKQTEFETSI